MPVAYDVEVAAGALTSSFLALLTSLTSLSLGTYFEMFESFD